MIPSFLPLVAAAAPDSPGQLLLTIAVLLVAAKLAGALADKLGQPAVLGELLVGILLGSSVLGWLPLPATDGYVILHFLAEIGVVLLLFEFGLETDLKAMFRVGPAALAVAAVGVAVPFLLGYWFWAHGPHGQVASTVPLAAAAIFVGAGDFLVLEGLADAVALRSGDDEVTVERGKRGFFGW